METHELSTARFPSLAPGAGHYESFYLKLANPKRPRGVWIRHTVFKLPGELPLGSLWCVMWREDGRPLATKRTMHHVGVDAGEYIHVGESRLGPGSAQGGVNEASWDLTFTQDAPLFTYQAFEWLYRRPVPRNKSLAIHPVATFSGTFSFGGHTFEIDGWPGMVGHNWGAEHPEEWIWLHGTFPDAGGAWFDGTIVRLKVGGRPLPWIPNGCLHLDGQQYRVGGPGKPRRPLTTVDRTRCDFTMHGKNDLVVRGTVEAPASHFVAWRYSDPFGGEHITTNSSVAAMTLNVSRPGREDVRLHVPAGAAYELGSYGEPAGIPVQSFPDP